MERMKETGLNSLLAGLVIVSVFLSAQVWFPPDQRASLRSQEPRVQPAPPVLSGRMPDIFRPERLYVRRKSGETAMVMADSTRYQRMWPRVKAMLFGMHPDQAPVLVEDPDLTDGDLMTMILPYALTVGEWADQWSWDTTGLRNHTLQMDRLIIYLGQNPTMYLRGPQGGYYKLGPLLTSEAKAMQETMAEVPEEQFVLYRPLDTANLPARIPADVVVPDVKEVPVGLVQTKRPDSNVEEVRYFPDLSVVRQVDEKDARSFTDGQRFLRLGANGLVEYRTATSPGTSPDLTKALEVAQEWVGFRGGWPDHLILSRAVQQPQFTTLEFDYRGEGPFPVESEGGALNLAINADRITYLKRAPDFSLEWSNTYQPIISPEAALQLATQDLPQLFSFEPLREMHLAYRLQLHSKGWVLEPAWVIQVGEARIYVSAYAGLDRRPGPDPG